MTFTAWEGELPPEPTADLPYADPHVPGAPTVTYATRTWTGPRVDLGFVADELVVSWNARTPGPTWIAVEARLEVAGEWSPWLVLARWCELDPDAGGAITRTSVPGQTGEWGTVDADTVRAAAGRGFTAWQARAVAASADGESWPDVALVGGAASAGAADPELPSEPAAGAGLEISVPPRSQRLHVDTFPEWDNGGQSWCSATSTTMLLHHWGLAPDDDETAWVGHDTDPDVVHAVRQVFDRSYGGAGNWPFNTAYAATRGLRAYVTRLRDLREAEAFIAAGIPLVVSVAFAEDELEGAGYATAGHLLTIVGFSATGDVVSNDPNSHRLPSNDEVRTVYRRDQFEAAWIGRAGGITYVMHPPEQPLPVPPAEANWG